MRRVPVLAVLIVLSVIPIHASSIICLLQTGQTGPFVTQACNQQLANPGASLNWSSVISANSPEASGPLTGSVAGNSVTVSSNYMLEGADNTALAWDGSSWQQAGFVTGATTFAGHFNSVTTPTGPPPEGRFGDNLLGVLAPAGPPIGDPTLTLNFSKGLSFVEFQVTARVGSPDPNDSAIGENTDFTGTLVAFDAQGNVLGSYSVIDQGTGGTCAGLTNTFGPQPCNDAPFFQFYNAQDQIASVELMIDDQTGMYVDSLLINAVPEPASFAMFSIGIFALLWAGQRCRGGSLPLLKRIARD
jgi:hypothetical protein